MSVCPYRINNPEVFIFTYSWKTWNLFFGKKAFDNEKLITAQMNSVQKDSSSISQAVPAEKTGKECDPNRT